MRRLFALVACTLAAGLALTACREDEQNRILSYEPGTYLGQPDSALSESTREALRARARYLGDSQSFASLGGGGGGSSTADVRPPVSPGGPLPDAARDAARVRVLKQGSD